MLKSHAWFALMFSLEELFCSVDDFCRSFEPQWKQQLLGFGLKRRNRHRSLSLSEIMTILIAFHQSCYRNFKAYYQEKVQTEWADAFPGLVSKRALHRMGAEYLSADVCLSALLFWQVSRHQFYGLHIAQSLPQPPHSAT
jgi:hypothetical protein